MSLELELHLARFDLRQVEDLVEQLEQVTAGRPDVFEVLLLFLVSSPKRRSSNTSEKPITAFSGVRSSWDMLARNSDLWRLATSSSRLLSASS